MEISYANSKIQKICTNEKAAKKELGKVGAQVLLERLQQMRDAETLADLRLLPGAYHELKGDRKNQISCRVSGLIRLIFAPANDPIPTKPDGGLDWTGVTAIVNLEITDYH